MPIFAHCFAVSEALYAMHEWKCILMTTFLASRSPYPVPKQILPARVLALISRGLAVNCTTLAKNLITDNIAVGALVPQLHIALFQLLDALILV